jgi:outer membrane receptor protein involved in Fe transport
MRKLTALAVLLLVSCPGYVRAQSSSASLTGYVTDPTKAFIVGAKVIVINRSTNVGYEGVTDSTGSYYVTNLPPGTYRMEVERPGFKTIVKSDVILHVQDSIAINFEMALGSVSEIVTVKGSTPLSNTTDGTVGTVIDRKFVGDLPLNGRSIQSLILLAPGVVPTFSSQGSPGEFSINGQRQNANYFTVDGISANTGIGTEPSTVTQQAGGAIPAMTAMGTTASLASIDALEEFKIQTSTYSAEFGRQPGGQVQLVTRSGTNQFHGVLFEYLRNDAMDATDWFANANALPKAPLRQNQFGGTLGGPIRKGKTFFFFSYEGLRLLLPVVLTDPGTVVPALWLRKAAAPAVQPFLNAYPLPTGPEIQALQNPNLPPQPNPALPNYNPYIPSGTAPFIRGVSNPSSVDAYSFRADHTVSSKLTLFGRYAQTPSNSLTRNLAALDGIISSNRVLTLGATASVTPRLSNQFRFNWTSNRSRRSEAMDNYGGATPITADALLAPYSGPGPKEAIWQWSPVCNFSASAIDTRLLLGDSSKNSQRQLNIADSVSWVKGSHQLKFGMDWRHLTPILANAAYRELARLNSPNCFDYAGMISNVISGTGRSIEIDANKGARPIYDNVSAYAQDTWKLSPRLTLDFGLRWEVNPAPHDANGVKPVLITGINGFDTSKATLAPPGAPFYRTIYTAFAPRVGMAYQLSRTSGRETVLRGGFGVYYDLGSEMASAGFNGYPFSSVTFLSNVSLPLSSAQAQPPAFPAVQFPLTGIPLNALNPDLKLPYTLQWNVALEQALGNQQTVTLSYVASAARRLTITNYLNTIPSNTIFVNPPDTYRPNPNFGDIFYTRNAPTSDYQSLQAQYQRRLSRGLQALVNYTWSHAIDEASFVGDVNTTLNRGNAAFDVRHNFSAAVTYELPKLNGAGHLAAPVARFVKAIANGWSLDSIFLARSGFPIDVLADSTFLPNGNFVVVRPDVVPGVPVWIKDPTVPGGQRLNTNAFAYPPTVPCPSCSLTVYQRPGTSPRNGIYLPGIYQLNMGVSRQINLGERWKVQVKGEAFNVLNHPLFTGYDNFWFPTSTTFGVPFSMLSNGGDTALNSLYQLGGPRSMQVSLRLSF